MEILNKSETEYSVRLEKKDAETGFGVVRDGIMEKKIIKEKQARTVNFDAFDWFLA